MQSQIKMTTTESHMGELESITSRIECAFKLETRHYTEGIGFRSWSIDDGLPAISMPKGLVFSSRSENLGPSSVVLNHPTDKGGGILNIRGLPEATTPKDIITTLLGIFSEIQIFQPLLLLKAVTEHFSLLMVLKTLDICKLHKYMLKERIMEKTPDRPFFDGAHLFFPPQSP